MFNSHQVAPPASQNRPKRGLSSEEEPRNVRHRREPTVFPLTAPGVSGEPDSHVLPNRAELQSLAAADGTFFHSRVPSVPSVPSATPFFSNNITMPSLSPASADDTALAAADSAVHSSALPSPALAAPFANRRFAVPSLAPTPTTQHAETRQAAMHQNAIMGSLGLTTAQGHEFMGRCNAALSRHKDETRCASFQYEDKHYTLINMSSKDYHYFQEIYEQNHLQAETLGLPVSPLHNQIITIDGTPFKLVSFTTLTDDESFEDESDFHQRVTFQLLNHLEVLHTGNYTHGDLTESNMYLDRRFSGLALADFKHLTRHTSKDVDFHLAKLIDIYDALNAAKTHLERIYKQPSQAIHVMEAIDAVLDDLEPYKSLEGKEESAITAEAHHILSKSDNTNAGDILIQLETTLTPSARP